MSNCFKELNEFERPREKMLERGISALTNEELLAILLRTGTARKSVIELAKGVLDTLNNFHDLRLLTIEELLQIDGIKLAKAATIIASVELGKRLSGLSKEEKRFIKSPEDVYNLLSYELSVLDQEHFLCIYIDIKGAVIRTETIYMGTINQTLIHPREVFKSAIKLSAAAMVLVHNHPSGDSKPSTADFKVTSKMQNAADIFGIDLIDHIVIGKNELYSIKGNRKIYM